MKNDNVPMRRCVGCMESKPQKELIRIAGEGGLAVIDLNGKKVGRGVYLCRDKQCFGKARKRRAITRGLSLELSEEELDRLFEELGQEVHK